MKSVIVVAKDGQCEARARAFAGENGYRYGNSMSAGADYFIVFEENKVGVATRIGLKTTLFYLDFATGSVSFRAKSATKQNELLAKAVGFRGRKTLSVIDATAGLGRDAWILATLGAHVMLFERSPLLALLLEDALSDVSDVAIKERLRFVKGDAISWLAQRAGDVFLADVVYLDPMFPHRTKSAAVKKEMLILRDLVGDDQDAAELFAAAFACSVSRVVVKRPIHAREISVAVKPTFSVKGRANRFDVYIKSPFSSI